jgi:hypothetical protein
MREQKKLQQYHDNMNYVTNGYRKAFFVPKTPAKMLQVEGFSPHDKIIREKLGQTDIKEAKKEIEENDWGKMTDGAFENV